MYKRQELYKTLALGALKYFILKVDPKRKMLFNPEESIDFQGNTGPFIQYNYARICSLLRKGTEIGIDSSEAILLENLEDVERDLIVLMNNFPNVVKEAADLYSPAIIAQYVYELAKTYSRFFNECPIFKNEDTNIIKYRLTLSNATGQIIEKGMNLLGINVPTKM